MDQFSPDPLSNEGISTASEDGAANRLETRDSLFLMADLKIEGGQDSCPVRVRNLSSGGLMAEFPQGLEQRLRVAIRVRGIGWLPGQVAWSAAGRVGIAFDHPIDPLLARKPVGQGARTTVFAKPVLTRNSTR